MMRERKQVCILVVGAQLGQEGVGSGKEKPEKRPKGTGVGGTAGPGMQEGKEQRSVVGNSESDDVRETQLHILAMPRLAR